MKRVLFLILWMVSAAILRADELPWESDYDKALATAKTDHKPILLDFSAPWCGPCRMMETTTFANTSVQNNLARYILVKVDFDQNAALAGKYRVQAIPASFVLNQFGERVAEHVGYIAPEAFRTWLATSYFDAFATTSKAQAAQSRVQGLVRGLDGPDVSARDRAAADLMNIYCAKDEDDDNAGARLVEQELRGFVGQHPAMALPFLNDHRLAVRLLFAALLAEKLGPDFQFDPWEKSDTRAIAVTALAKKLDPPR